jgi:hypothetical protein
VVSLIINFEDQANNDPSDLNNKDEESELVSHIEEDEK